MFRTLSTVELGEPLLSLTSATHKIVSGRIEIKCPRNQRKALLFALFGADSYIRTLNELLNSRMEMTGEPVDKGLPLHSSKECFRTYHIDLEKLNEHSATPWSLEYSMKSAYQMDEISPQSFAKLVENFRRDPNGSHFKDHIKHHNVMRNTNSLTEDQRSLSMDWEYCSHNSTTKYGFNAASKERKKRPPQNGLSLQQIKLSSSDVS
ncbi:hypothetical protein DdX_16477 [Ditylenchus destructor]|uniref:Sphingomyelin phosphodiesterase C-terminal domain-containing protein n=1 Tax=Ditylenchus destructor TaxID=166010 RepID=A0AAD4MPG7_9BILA|nr:hypothetical protein DdX_16477 [Ditylenchus destructor]